MVARFLSGLPHGAFFGVGSVVAMRIADPGKESQAIALMFAGLTVANLLGIPLTTSLALMVGWQVAFVIVALIGIMTVVTVLLFIPNLELEKSKHASLTSDKHILLKSNSWLALGVVSLGFAGLFAWYSYISPLMINVTQLSNSTIPYILFLAGLGMFFGNLYGGKLTDRVGAMNATVVTLIGLVLALLLMYLSANFKFFAIVISFGLGFFAFALVHAVQTLIIEVFKGSEMLGSTLSIAGFNIANAIGAFAGGLPIAYGLSYSSSVVAGMIVSILGVLMIFMLKYRLSVSVQSV